MSYNILRYFPRGGGHVTIEVNPVQSLRGADFTERGTLLNIHGWSFVAGSLPIKVRIDIYSESRQIAFGS